MKILFLASNPNNKARLRLDEEVREIKDSLQRSQYRQHIEFETRGAVRSRDLQQALLEVKPTIVHFSGHGDQCGLMLEDNNGEAHYVPEQAVANLFKLFAKHLQCVILNACYSENQAKAITQHIPYVIGMNDEIRDVVAVEFSRAFYDALGAGKDIEFAYAIACNALHLQAKEGEHLIPVLLTSTTKPTNTPTAMIKPTLSKTDTLRRDGLLGRKQLLLDKLNRLEQSYDLENRVESQMRMEKVIAGTKKTLEEVEKELALYQ